MWRDDEAAPFHTEVGYWLWEPKTGLIMQSVTIPRGQVVLAAGHAKPGDKKSVKSEKLSSSWADDAAKAIRDLVAALPPDPARVCRCGAPTTNRYNVTVPHIAEVECCSIECCRAATAEATEDARTFGWVPATEPDPAPPGERRPCAGWVTLKDSPGYKLVEVRIGGLRLAAWWSALLPMQQPVAWEVSDAQRVIAHDSAGDNIATLEAAQLAAEDAAAELLRAGLRALGRGGK